MAKNFLSLARGRLVQGNVYTSRSALSDINTRGTAERFISVKVETARIFNWLQNYPTCEFTHEEIFKIYMLFKVARYSNAHK